MSDVEFADGGSFNFAKLPDESMQEFCERMKEQSDREFNEFKEQMTGMGLGAMFDGSMSDKP